MIEYPVTVQLQIGNKSSQLLLDPDQLHRLVSAEMKKQFVINPDAKEEEKTLARAARALVKGGLIAFGPKILDLLFKTKDHPKPGKNDDIIEWYADMFAKVLIAGATQGTLVLEANTGEYGHVVPIIINQIRPVATSNQNGTGAGTGDGTSQQDASGVCV